MGAVLTQLREMLLKRLDADAIVVWYDPGGDYASVAEHMEFDETRVAAFQGSYFGLRRAVEPLLREKEKPRLLIYVNAPRVPPSPLVELEAAGTLCEPGAPTGRNTKLEVVVRAALKAEGWSKASVEEEVKNVSSGSHDLGDVEALIERGPVAGTGALALVYNSSAHSDIALKYLTSTASDDDLVAKNGLPELKELVETAFGLEPDQSATPADLRKALRRHVLLTDFRATLGEGAELESLSAVPMPERKVQVDACTNLADTWRLRSDLSESYAAAANQVEIEYPLAEADIEAGKLADVETFRFAEEALLGHAEELLLEDRIPEVLELFESRRSSFWNRYLGRYALHWSLIARAGQVLSQAARVKEQAGQGRLTGGQMVAAYAHGKDVTGGPWSELDRHHRGFEKLYGEFEPAAGSESERFEQLVAKVRNVYMQAARELAEAFSETLVETDFELADCTQQTETFRDRIGPHLGKEKVAYLLVDALRYEMARELASILDEEAQLVPSVAIAPTLTKLGMAALLPGAEEGLGVKQTGETSVGAEVRGKVVRTRAERMEALRSQVDVPLCVLKLDDVVQCRKPARAQIDQSDLVVVTSQEIDEICERGEESLARRLMHDVLRLIRRAIRNLADRGVATVVITADHGYLFGESLDSSMKVDPPSGTAVELHRRAWIGQGAGEHASALRVKSGELGLAGGLEFAFPRSFAVFKAPGAPSAYVHGGMSLQELVVPVLVVHCKHPERGEAAEGIRYDLGIGRRQVTTRMFTVRAKYTREQLFAPEKTRVIFRAMKGGEVIGTAATAMYGFQEATKEVVLEEGEENHVTILLEGEDLTGKVSVRMLDTDTEAELARIDDIELRVSM